MCFPQARKVPELRAPVPSGASRPRSRRGCPAHTLTVGRIGGIGNFPLLSYLRTRTLDCDSLRSPPSPLSPSPSFVATKLAVHHSSAFQGSRALAQTTRCPVSRFLVVGFVEAPNMHKHGKQASGPGASIRRTGASHFLSFRMGWRACLADPRLPPANSKKATGILSSLRAGARGYLYSNVMRRADSPLYTFTFLISGCATPWLHPSALAEIRQSLQPSVIGAASLLRRSFRGLVGLL